jgi:hypothetical protein
MGCDGVIMSGEGKREGDKRAKRPKNMKEAVINFALTSQHWQRKPISSG